MSDLLSSAELNELKAMQENDMPETVYVQAVVETSDGAGGRTSSMSTTATTKGRISAMGNSAAEREIAGKLTGVQPVIIKLPADTVVTNKNQLQINGHQYNVHAVLEKSHKTVLRVVCSEAK